MRFLIISEDVKNLEFLTVLSALYIILKLCLLLSQTYISTQHRRYKSRHISLLLLLIVQLKGKHIPYFHFRKKREAIIGVRLANKENIPFPTCGSATSLSLRYFTGFLFDLDTNLT